ncbi:MAG: anthranilate phosphoribosyltransferase [Deltaproteobacteria bacterium]|nr:anthranilate phosphoribosyltransferase [Deltaproteobacteria bacterium]
MQTAVNREFGGLITRLVQKENLSREEAKGAFYTILRNETTDMQQGAFLAAMTAKGETEEEVAGSWEAIYELDTVKVVSDDPRPIVENCGTGMDTFKTFNISTAASIIAASGGIRMARHGARAITSLCGTVDMAEALGVDVECSVDVVAESINRAGIGLFNGMSAEIHPQALGRILSNIHFGSTLNIAASLANPAMPKIGVRGVYAKEMIIPVVRVMKAIGYERALVLYGGIDNSLKGMDEASVCGRTYCAELKEDGEITEYDFRSEDYGLTTCNPSDLAPVPDMDREARDFVALLRGEKDGARFEAAALNAGLIFYLAGNLPSIQDGVDKACSLLKQGSAFNTLENWVKIQNRDPKKGVGRLWALTKGGIH